jgi:serine protease AprX
VYYSVITPDITGIDDGRDNDKLYSVAASPDPFTDRTTITYKIAAECPVRMSVLNLFGKEIQTLVNRRQPAGTYTVEFDGGLLPAGYYLCRMNAGPFTKTAGLVKVD